MKPAVDASSSVRGLLHWTSEYLARAGVESPDIEATLLLAEALAVDPMLVCRKMSSVLPPEKYGRFIEAAISRTSVP